MTTNSIYTQYFTYTNDNYVKYGDKTVVLLQVGAFFEVYGVKSIPLPILFIVILLNLLKFVN